MLEFKYFLNFMKWGFFNENYNVKEKFQFYEEIYIDKCILYIYVEYMYMYLFFFKVQYYKV